MALSKSAKEVSENLKALELYLNNGAADAVGAIVELRLVAEKLHTLHGNSELVDDMVNATNRLAWFVGTEK